MYTSIRIVQDRILNRMVGRCGYLLDRYSPPAILALVYLRCKTINLELEINKGILSNTDARHQLKIVLELLLLPQENRKRLDYDKLRSHSVAI